MTQNILTEQDQAFYQAIERYRRACNCKREDIIDQLRDMAHGIIDQDYEDYKSGAPDNEIIEMMEARA